MVMEMKRPFGVNVHDKKNSKLQTCNVEQKDGE